MQGANIRDNLNEWAQGNPALLAAAGIKSAAEVDKIYRMGGQFGGPIKQDKIWFFTAIAPVGLHRAAAERVLQPAAGQGEYSWQGNHRPDADAVLSRPAGYRRTPTSAIPTHPWARRPLPASTGIAPTRVASRRRSTSKNRINFYADLQKDCRCTTGPFTGANSIESERGWDWYPSGVVQGTWTAPVTSRLLLEAGAVVADRQLGELRGAGRHADDRSILETATNYRYGAHRRS